MKLRPTHFDDPEPKNKFGLDVFEQEEYREAHSEWEKRQVKPEDPKIDTSIHGWETEHKEWQKALQYYEENRRRFDGFTSDEAEGNWYFQGPNNLDIDFDRDGISLYSPPGERGISCIFDNGLSISLFEQICSENNIELKKI